MAHCSPTPSMRRWLRRFTRLLLACIVVIIGLLAWNLRAPAVGEPTNFVSRTGDAVLAPSRLRLVTWNVWGLRWITPRRAERIESVAREVAALTPDIVAFQEAYVS